MKKLGKVLTVLLPVVALFLESLPYGAVLIFKDFPDRTIRTTYSYFMLRFPVWDFSFYFYCNHTIALVLALVNREC